MSDLKATREPVQEISQQQRKLRDDAIENQLSSLTKRASMLKLKIMDIMQEYASIRSLPTHILSEFGIHASSVIELCQDFIYERNEGGTDPWETSPEDLATFERQLRRTLVMLETLVEGWEEMDDELAENTTTDEEEEDDEEEEELMQDVIK